MMRADMAGFSCEEVEIAFARCGDKNPLAWLQTEWTSAVQGMLTSVGEIATNMGIISHLTEEDAKEALVEANGDEVAAMNKCASHLKEQFDALYNLHQYTPEDIHASLLTSGGDVNAALTSLNMDKCSSFVDRIWMNTSDSSDADYIHPEVKALIMDKHVNFERRARLAFIETKIHHWGWGRAENVVKMVDVTDPEIVDLADIVEAVHNCGDLTRSLEYLQNECETCYITVPPRKIVRLARCSCQICVDCFEQHFSIVVKEKHVKDFVCPVCQEPDIDNEELAEIHLQFLDMLLRQHIGGATHTLFNNKLTDWNLMKEPNFRWCAHCQSGFIYNGERLRMTCSNCKKYTCFDCKKPWEDQHDGITCEQFQLWKEANDPSHQAAGLARHLEENGIDCPNCQFRYTLARGGCMHFKCTQCRHEFCAGCYHPFRQGATCGLYRRCQKSGLHCHHPRDCLYYLRDNTVIQLQKLLKDNNVKFDTEPSQEAAQHGKCIVMEQKDGVDGLVDEACNRDVSHGHAGLCRVHYTEYLVGLINRHQIDPVVIMELEELKTQLTRVEKQCPPQNQNENNNVYKARLITLIKKDIPLKPMRKVSRAVLNRPQGGATARARPRTASNPAAVDIAENEIYE